MASSKKLKTLLLHLIYAHQASYYDDWSDAFQNSPDFDCTQGNILTLTPSALRQMIDGFDAIVLLHSCNADTLDYIAPLANVLGERRNAKLLTFIGNEFNSPYVSMPKRTELMAEMRADLIATQLMGEAGSYLYAGAHARVISCAHALNPQAFRPGPDHRHRSLDIGVKGYRYPPYLGDDDRNRLIRCFRQNDKRFGFSVSIGEDTRVDRAQWSRFLADCRGTISTEVGSWYIQPDDALISRIYEHLKSKRTGIVLKNDSRLRRLSRRLPMRMKTLLWQFLQKGIVKYEVFDDFLTSFEELDELFFKHELRAPVYGKAISSRHFDAIGTKCCQILQEGRYNDILAADEHYVAVKHDLSNLDEAIERFKDQTERALIVDRAYDHILSNHTYAHRTRQIRAELER